MKLFEVTTITPHDLEQHQETNFSLDQVISDLKHEYDTNFTEIGNGMFAVALSTQQEPGTVRKVVHTVGEDPTELKSDAYFNYLMSMATNDRMSKNPYFPKVYKVEIMKTSQDVYAYAVDMERLHPIAKATTKDLMAIGTLMFDGFEAEAQKSLELERKNHANGQSLTGDLESSRKTIRNLLLDAIEQYIRGRSFEGLKIKDPYFRHAVAVTKQARRATRGAWTDIHDQNIMIRRSPYGSHLVITDPIAAG